ncbi:MAG: FAD-dependent oxidoreductase [Flavobacteriaceae bacterium]|nr:FAD-dependent oxidoreductase [Bacteroidia bacterium]MBT8288747.1 FAD-dependent oxidoreductase [Bacteroidia bacterium]NNF73682.1 FAD-dependent oxidoreductase [Flavobacteriaceae bacterium]NNK71760.1 FAD-dependent oxidoreductase [Flavobacteriaceae bacterium]
MSKKVIVIGGGVIGLCSAYYLHKNGHEVIVIDKSNMDEGASFVNAGYLSPSHIIPLAAPGVMRKGLRWMFNSSSPLYIKPRFEADLLRWGLAFNKSCNPRHVKKSIPAIRDIAVLSQELYDAIKEDENFTFHYEKKGLMMLCLSMKGLEEEMKIADQALRAGLEVNEIKPDDIAQLEPKAKINAVGGTYYKCDYHTTPHEFMNDLKSYLEKAGVKLYKNEAVRDFSMDRDRIQMVITEKQILEVDEVVLTAGAWSGELSKKLQLNLLLQAGKGYRINTTTDYGITLPAILSEKKIAVTPMNGFTRIAGTMEIAGINSRINKVRVEAIAKGVKLYYPNLSLTETEQREAACGLRPVSPDGLPYIGRSKGLRNLTVGAGHAMMGWSMATATGKLIQETIENEKPSIDMTPFHPDRKF